MHVSNDADLPYVWVPTQCDPAGNSAPPPAFAGLYPYDPDTMDAVMLFHSVPTTTTIGYYYPYPAPYYPVHAVAAPRRQSVLVRERDDETRRAMHREVQRRFVRRKQAEFADLRSRARKWELRHRTLLLRAETERLREERAWLRRECRVRDMHVEDDEVEGEEEEEEKEDRETNTSDETTGRRQRPAWPRHIFEFHLSSDSPSD